MLNKSDLTIEFDRTGLADVISDTIMISAKFSTNIESLMNKIQQVCGIEKFNISQPICFTARQEKLLKKLAIAKSKDSALSTITELLNGKLHV